MEIFCSKDHFRHKGTGVLFSFSYSRTGHRCFILADGVLLWINRWITWQDIMFTPMTNSQLLFQT